jgi:hypothetical protein
MFIKIVGPLLSQFDPTKFVESWQLLGHRSAIDTKSKERNRDIEPPEGMTQIWSFTKMVLLNLYNINYFILLTFQ